MPTAPLTSRLTALPRPTRDTLFLLAVLGLIALQMARVLPLWAAALGLGLLAWRVMIAVRGTALPGRPALLALLALGVAAALYEARASSISGAALAFLLVLLALKTLEMNSRRDAFVLFFLGFFCIVSNFLYVQSIGVALAMLLAFWGLLTALVNAQRPLGPAPLRESARTAAQLVLLGLPLIAALYLVFPRFPPLWGLPVAPGQQGITGLSGQMQVGSIAQLAQDQRVALRVRFDADSPVPAQQQLYFRGPVLSRLNGRQWTAEDPLPTSAEAAPGSAQNPIEPLGEPLRYEMMLEPHQQRWLLPLDVLPEPPQGSLRAMMTQEMVWLSYRPLNGATRYHASSYTRYQSGRTAGGPALQRYLRLPAEDNPRTREWALQLRQQFGLAQASGGDILQSTRQDAQQALIDHVLARLREQDYQYTLEPPLYGPDTADDFWFTHRQGFCEHIASAFAILMRAAGIPARMVTGYQGGELNPVDGVWTVRQADAHAWTEVWLAGEGWRRIDPTAAISPERVNLSRIQALQGGNGAASGRSGGVPGWLWQARSLMEAVDYRWTQWVLNYNQDEQQTLLQRLGVGRLDWAQLAGLTAALLVLTALLYLALPLLRRQRRDPWLRLLERTRERLQDAGLALPDNTPPRAMAQQAQRFFGTEAAPVSQWLIEMDRLRYAQHSDTDLARLARRWKALPWPRAPKA
ncbi:DUF3488 domain-containing protein [Corticibacter populi]|uniref:DUF3488 domain-containing protein n=1 Tax=Corticibacter populi TaxID=1550736 RepID=A0A3M6QMK0_9BURK|nr:DUF3488 and transglutaminase-like domain-containing protein [Corticibacter populi]RMX04318.1 DUF3488 domain-containing protein [Corticibacter populi]RZS33141.1 transglutaminase superfamily protein [Corticibacter populi]